ncbi:MAG TPA: glycine-rich protein, partial [Solirubrobacteraceae bacterium]|nr:glycine-rich protein [Solirubrobacteraceae bacterium]
TYLVPAGITSISVTATGGSGGNGANSTGGLAAIATGNLAVTPGETLYVEVGGAGDAGNLSDSSDAGGFNGGAAGSTGGAGGGGAADVRTCSTTVVTCPDGSASSLASRLLVGGGGGGAGAQGYGFEFGGLGGTPDATAGVSSFGGGGDGGTTTGATGGSGGSGNFSGRGQTGAFGLGGAGGGPAPVCGQLGGGGGGGGWYGGGGGGGVNSPVCSFGAAAGGGGGSSYGPAGTTFAQAAVAGAGSVTISFNDTTPPVITPTVLGTLGNNGWYTSNVSLNWSVSELQSPLSLITSGCASQTITADQPATPYSCSASSNGGSSGPVTVTIKRDATAPTVTFTGDAGAYTVDQAITIACTASDALSGVASSTCASNSLVAVPAYTLALGAHSLAATAIDNAGNNGSSSASFTVSVNSASLCNLTTHFIAGSAAYQRLSAGQQAVVNKLASAACLQLTSVTARTSPLQKALLIGIYRAAVMGLAGSGWLSSAQGKVLSTLAGNL